MTFKIKPYNQPSETKNIRFPVELIEEIENAIMGKNITFSYFVKQACRYALDNMEIKENSKQKESNKMCDIIEKITS